MRLQDLPKYDIWSQVSGIIYIHIYTYMYIYICILYIYGLRQRVAHKKGGPRKTPQSLGKHGPFSCSASPGAWLAASQDQEDIDHLARAPAAKHQLCGDIL